MFPPGFERTQTAPVSAELGGHRQLTHLTENLEDHLLRGVRIHRALGGFGTHWASCNMSERERAASLDEYAMSERVEQLDDFISHDWRAGRWPKFLALCIVYNGLAATVAGVLTVAIPLLMGAPALPLPGDGRMNRVGDYRFETHTTFIQGLGLIVFWIFFFFWQNFQGMFQSYSRYAFVDKFCINQTQDDLKKQGILSLAGFMQRSDRLVLLWSSQYFSRLWCVYEVASWLRLGRSIKDTVLVMPVDVAVVLIAVTAFLDACRFPVKLIIGAFDIDALEGGTWRTILWSIMWVHLVRQPAKAMLDLPRKLDSFSVSDSQCFCCANQHVHPENGKSLPCDRKLVYRALTKWFGQHGTPPRELASEPGSVLSREHRALYAFDQHVQTNVRKALLQDRGAAFKINYSLVLIATLGHGLYWLDKFFSIPHAPLEVKVRIFIQGCSIYFGEGPCTIAVGWGLTCMAARRGYGERGTLASLALTSVIGLATAGAAMTLRQPPFLALDAGITAQFGVAAAMATLTYWFYGPKRCCRGHRLATPEQRRPSCVMSERGSMQRPDPSTQEFSSSSAHGGGRPNPSIQELCSMPGYAGGRPARTLASDDSASFLT